MADLSLSTENIENTLREILERLERIESKMDENCYPSEESIREDFIGETEAIRKEIKAGHISKCRTTKDLFAGITDE